jgi:hypothetical protein
MKIARGKSRKVWIFEKIVLKFPVMHFKEVCKTIIRSYRHGQLLRCLKADMNAYGQPRRRLFLGIRDNWSEFVFYVFHPSPFLMPTYFSLFGLLNIQKRGEKARIERINLLSQLRVITNDAIKADGHAFLNTDNFCVLDGHLLMVDYGSPKTQGVLKEYGDKIHRDFNLDYKRPEFKEKK